MEAFSSVMIPNLSNPGWEINVDFGLYNYIDWGKYDPNGILVKKCGNGKKWFGFSKRYDVESINTILSGCGCAKLNFGNCAHSGRVVAYKKGKELGMADALENRTITFEFFDGDLIEIHGYVLGVILLNDFVQITCPGESKIFIHKL